MKINQNFFKIESSYLFSTVARKQREYQEAHPEADIIRLSIGDVTRPLVPSVIDAMHKAVDEMANEATFRGYPPEHGYEFILCFPNNPTGMCATKAQLKKWVDYALANDALIIFDSAYEAFIVEDDVPHSIYEIEGAEKCAIELRSFSKTAGFTGVRCGYTVVPKACVFEGKSLNPMWARRQATKFNGVSYITQRAAEAVYTEQGQKEIKETLAYYQKNAKVIFEGMQAAGFTCYGAVNSPYVWLKVPEGMTSWEFFDLLLDKTHVVGTPGSGFGPSGEGFFRLTAFGNADKTVEAVERIKAYFAQNK